jgi:aspartyl-tRNA(Asn)/glutamyl-tRNA(Gln) amidotransferase subunit A
LTDPALLTLTEAAAAIRGRQISSVELTKALLARIELWQPKLQAFVRFDPDEVLGGAAEADAALARGEVRGPLHGVPLAHKDMYYRAGKLAECGSKVRAGWTAPATSTALLRLSNAGAIYLGALHMSEFAYGPTGHNSHLGHGRNAWNPEHITGGSSSGSGTAVAARLTPAALGSDTGGSIRLPAHFCGVTGLKPTSNRVSRANAMPLSFTLDTVGPLGRSAEDCGLILRIIGGPDPLDPTTSGAPAWSEEKAARPARELTIGIPKSFYTADLTPEVAKAMDEATLVLRGLGCNIREVNLPDQTLVSAAAQIVVAVEAASYHAPWLRTRRQDYTALTRSRLENGLAYSAVEYLEALRWRGPALEQHLAAIGTIDAILAPVSRAAAPTITETDVGGGPGAEAAIQAITRFMRPVNYLGLPALVFPAGRTPPGLPVGLQLIGRPFGDETLVALGKAFQAATDHHKAVPALP